MADRRRDIAELLLAHGADPNAEVDWSGTPVSRAEGDPELVALLRAHGGRAEPSERDRAGALIAQGRLDEAEAPARASRVDPRR